MADASDSPPPVRQALDDVVSTSRTVLMQRLDLLQLEAQQMVDNVAIRMGEASVAIVLSTLALVCGTVSLIAYGEPHFGLAHSSGMVATAYFALSWLLTRAAKRRRPVARSKGKS